MENADVVAFAIELRRLAATSKHADYVATSNEFLSKFFADTDIFDEAEECVNAVAKLMSDLSETKLLNPRYGTCISKLEK